MPASTDTPASDRPHIGVLAMQGAFAEHVRALEDVGADAREIRTLAELEAVDGIVIPGGESTAIRKALHRSGLLEPLRARIAGGLPAFGTCAGLIVLAHADADGAPDCYGLLDVDVERNGFGRQPASAERTVQFSDGVRAHGVFIRAPRVTRLGDGVEVLATIRLDDGNDEPVVVRQGSLLGATYHPELTGDRTLHELFIALVRNV